MDPTPPALDTLPPLRGISREALTLTRLGGITNRTYRIQGPGLDAVLRLPGVTSAPMINRQEEAHNHDIAARQGIALSPIWRDIESGRHLMPYLPKHRALSPDVPLTDDDINRIGALLRRCRGLSGGFLGIKTPEVLIRRYHGLLTPLEGRLPEGYGPSREVAEGIIQRIADAPWPLAPAHMDATLGNILLDSSGDREADRLIDWEFSGLASPAWDIAMVALEGKLEGPRVRRLLEVAELPSGPEALRRIGCYQVLITFVWGQWALVRHSLGDSYLNWAQGCFAQVLDWAESPPRSPFSYALTVGSTP